MKVALLSLATLMLSICATQPEKWIDVLIINGSVFNGSNSSSKSLDVGVCGDEICVLTSSYKYRDEAKRIIDATGLIVSPGFIDPHTQGKSILIRPYKQFCPEVIF